MLRDTVALAQELARVHVAVVCPSEDVDEIGGRLPAGVHVVGQRGDGLAAALVSAFEHFVPDFRRVIAVDGDSPHLPFAILESAFEASRGERRGDGTDRGWRLISRRGVGDSPAPL